MYPNESNQTIGSFVREQIESIHRRGIDDEILFINGRESIFNYIKGLFQVIKKTFKGNYDLIHSHYGLTGLVARCQWKCPLVVSFHGSDINVPWQGFLSKFLAKYTNKSIVVSKELNCKLKAKNSIVIPCGVNLTLMKPLPLHFARKKLNLSVDKKYILFPGDPENQIKRYDVFSEVLNILNKNDLAVEELVFESVPHNMISLYYNASDVLVMTSDREGSPVAIKEAMACNLPIVSVDVGDVKEIIGDTEGCYIAKRDPEDIAKKVELVLKRNKRTNGRDKVKHLSLENIASRIIDVYKSIQM